MGAAGLAVVRGVDDERLFEDAELFERAQDAPHVPVDDFAGCVVADVPLADVLAGRDVAALMPREGAVIGVETLGVLKVFLGQLLEPDAPLVMVPELARRAPAGVWVREVDVEDPGPVFGTLLAEPAGRLLLDHVVAGLFRIVVAGAGGLHLAPLGPAGDYFLLAEERVDVQAPAVLCEELLLDAVVALRLEVELADGRKQDALFPEVVRPAARRAVPGAGVVPEACLVDVASGEHRRARGDAER